MLSLCVNQNVDRWLRVNFIPNDKILAWSKLKTFADDKLDVVKMVISLFDSLENTVLSKW